ncbi:restriction endonuclease [Kitasatospora sp. NPDC058965]|uniref:restriction endonuclease n=1 Tax=Kitasatospora sp. NPDC058965 TaxID=3346682 RepID=UPI00369B7093
MLRGSTPAIEKGVGMQPVEAGIDDEIWEELAPGHRLVGPPPDLPPPLQVTAPLLLNADQLSWESLEHLIVALAREVDGATRARLYGRRGQKQHGIDVVGYFADDSLTAYQAKRWKNFAADDLTDAVREYADGKRPFAADRFVVVTTAYIGDTAVEQRLRQLQVEYHPLDIDLWGCQQLSERLFRQPELVARFFGRATAEIFCSSETVTAASRTGRQVGADLRGFTDPFALDVHRVIQIEGEATSNHLPLLPAYVTRRHDLQLGEVVAAAAGGLSKLVVLVGDSSTGKTRACWEALHKLPAGWRLWQPIAPSPAQALLDGVGSVGPQTVLWLDELAPFLSTPGSGQGELVAAALRDLLNDSARRPVLILGTVWPKDWDLLTALPEPGRPDHHRQARTLLSGRSVPVPPAFDESALSDAREASRTDKRFAEAVEVARDRRIAQYLSAAFALMERYSTAPISAQAVLHAAMDARRLGCRRELSHALLEAAAVGYLTDDEWDSLRDGWFDDALSFLGRPCRGATSPIIRIRPRPGDMLGNMTRYRLADYLDQFGRSSRAIIGAPDTLWSALPAHADQGDLGHLAWTARNRGLFHHAFLLHLRAVEEGNEDTLWLAGDLMERAGQHEQALQWYRRSAEAGDNDAYGNVVALFATLDRQDDAIEWLMRRAEAGDDLALSWAAEEIAEIRGVDQALNWLNCFIERGNADAILAAAQILEETGNPAEAVNLYQRAAELGDTLAPVRFARLLLETAGAKEALQRLDELERQGITDLRARAELLDHAGQSVEALACYKRAAADGNGMVLDAAAKLAVQSEGIEATLSWLEACVASGSIVASAVLVNVLLSDGRTDDALHWCKQNLSRLNLPAFQMACEILQATGGTEEAISWLTDLADQGHGFALWRMAGLSEENGRIDEVTVKVKELANRGQTTALHLAAFLTARVGAKEEAVEWYRRAILAGEAFGIAELADLLEELGKADEADRVRRYGLTPSGRTATGQTVAG